MLPITRATVDNFCCVCLQLVGELRDKNSLHHDIKDDPQLMRVLEAMADENQSNLAVPTQLCHSCFTKITMFRKFAEVSICSRVTLSELIEEHKELYNNGKFNIICATCFKLKSDSPNSLHLLNEVQLLNLFRVIFKGINKRNKICNENIHPRMLCGVCFRKCRTFVEFQTRIKESHQYFRSILSNAHDITKTQPSHINEKEDDTEPVSTPDEENSIINESEPEIDNIISKPPSDNGDPIELCDSTTKDSISCNEIFMSSRTFHYETEGVPVDLLYCQLCKKRFQTKLQMRNHGYRVHCKAENICLYCQREFKRKHHLKDHVKTVHEGIRPYKCTYCDRSFGLSKTLRVHLMGHTNERPFGCETCQKTFRQKAELNRHLKNHSSDVQFRCPICSQGKTNQMELDEHLTKHNNIEDYQCSKCGRKFKKLCHLKNHDDAVHLKLRPFKCDFIGCEKTFAARKTLQTHRHTHTGDSSNTCDICRKEFSNRANLLRHSYMHKVTVSKECNA